jgi:hypothetical protein
MARQAYNAHLISTYRPECFVMTAIGQQLPGDPFRLHCIVAFIDILGWKDRVADGIWGDDERTRLVTALEEAGRPAVVSPSGSGFPIHSGLPVRIQFSDSIMIFMDMTVGGSFQFPAFFGVLDGICKSLLRNGLFPRGGIAAGSMYFRPAIIFGPALTDAYKIEQEISRYPRIIGNSSPNGRLCFALPDDPARGPDYRKLFKEDKDDHYLYYDMLCLFPEEFPPETVEDREHHKKFLNLVGNNLRKYVAEHKDNWRVLEKYLWFARYFNNVALDFEIEPLKISPYSAAKRRYFEAELEKSKNRTAEIEHELANNEAG